MDGDTIQLLINWGLFLVASGFLAMLRTVMSNGKRITSLEAKAEAYKVGDELSKVHERVDEVAESTAEVKGQLTAANNTLGLILQELISSRGNQK